MRVRARPATLADAAALSRIGAETFRDTFAASNTTEDMAAYLAGAFTPERQRAEIGDAGGFSRVGEHTFVLGGDAQTDWLMARDLDSP